MIPQIDSDAGCVRVAAHVAESLLCDAEDLVFKRGGERTVSASNVDLDGEAIAARLLCEASEARRQRVLRRDGAKVPNAAASLRETLAHVLASAVDLLAGCGDLRLRQELRGEFELDGDAVEALSEGVVNLARDPVALGKD